MILAWTGFCAAIFIILMVLTSARPGVAQTAKDYLVEVADTYSHLKTIQVEADVERHQANQPRGLNLALTLRVAQPDEVRIEAKNRSKVLQWLLIANGEQIAEYTATSKEYSLANGRISVTFSPDRGIGLGEMVYDSIADDVIEATIRGTQTLSIGADLIPCVVVDVTYVSQTPSKFSFWIAHGLVLRRAVTYWAAGGTNTLVSSVRAMTLDEEIPDSTFEFEIPEDVEQTKPNLKGPVALIDVIHARKAQDR